MKLTKKSKYAVRAMVEIALNERGPVGVAEIARRQRMPERFLEQSSGSCAATVSLRAVAGRMVGIAWRYQPRK